MPAMIADQRARWCTSEVSTWIGTSRRRGNAHRDPVLLVGHGHRHGEVQPLLDRDTALLDELLEWLRRAEGRREDPDRRSRQSLRSDLRCPRASRSSDPSPC